MSALLDTPPTIERETLHFPQFADWDFGEINGAEALKKIKEEAAKPLVVWEVVIPWFHWSHFASIRDARLRCAERSLSDSDSDDVKAAIMREAVSDEPCAKEAKAYVPIRTFKRPKS